MKRETGQTLKDSQENKNYGLKRKAGMEHLIIVLSKDTFHSGSKHIGLICTDEEVVSVMCHEGFHCSIPITVVPSANLMEEKSGVRLGKVCLKMTVGGLPVRDLHVHSFTSA